MQPIGVVLKPFCDTQTSHVISVQPKLFARLTKYRYFSRVYDAQRLPFVVQKIARKT